jgi:hypothetical protein
MVSLRRAFWTGVALGALAGAWASFLVMLFYPIGGT